MKLRAFATSRHHIGIIYTVHLEGKALPNLQEEEEDGMCIVFISRTGGL